MRKYVATENFGQLKGRKFATSKTLVNSMKKMMLCLKLDIFQVRKS